MPATWFPSPTNGALLLSIVTVLACSTIIAYAGAVIVEAIAGGVFTGVIAERRKERTIESLNELIEGNAGEVDAG